MNEGCCEKDWAMRAKKEDHDVTWLWECQQSVYQADEGRSIPDRKRRVPDKGVFLDGKKSKCGWGVECAEKE